MMHLRRALARATAVATCCPSLAACVSLTAATTQNDVTGRWTLESTPERGSDTVRVIFMDWPGAHGSKAERRLALRQLEGLTPAFLASVTPARVHFRLRGDAGTFAFVGHLQEWRAAGEFTFAADVGFATELARRDIGHVSPRQQLALALHDIGIAYVDELRRHGYERPSVDDLIRAGEHGVSLDYARVMSPLGFRSVSALAPLRTHDVSPNFVLSLRALGYDRLTTEQLVDLKDHGVTPEFIRRTNERAGQRLPVGSLIALRDRGEG